MITKQIIQGWYQFFCPEFWRFVGWSTGALTVLACIALPPTVISILISKYQDAKYLEEIRNRDKK